MSAALDELRSAYSSDAFAGPADLPVVGYVGRDTPIELITAVGAHGLRLRAARAAETREADELLGLGVDPAVRGILAGVLAGAFGELSAIAVSSDCDSSQRLFYILRELLRRGAALPPVWLVDLLHSPTDPVAAYNRRRIAEAIPFFETAGTRALTPDNLSEAIARHTRTRSLLRDVLGLRRDRPARLSGTDALAVIGALTRLPLGTGERRLQELLDGSKQLAPREGVRVYLSGSAHDSAEVYQSIESTGAIVVGEDHEWGEIAAEHDPRGNDLDALALHYRDNGPSAQRASIAARARYAASSAARSQAEYVVTYAREKDDAPLWDASTIVRAANLPSLQFTEQPHRTIDHSAIVALTDLRAEVGA